VLENFTDDCLGCTQGRNEVRWGPGQEASLAPLCSNQSFFGSKCTVLKKVLVTLLGFFVAPSSDSAPGELCPPCPPRYAPGCTTITTKTKLCKLPGNIDPHSPYNSMWL